MNISYVQSPHVQHLLQRHLMQSSSTCDVTMGIGDLLGIAPVLPTQARQCPGRRQVGPRSAGNCSRPEPQPRSRLAAKTPSTRRVFSAACEQSTTHIMTPRTPQSVSGDRPPESPASSRRESVSSTTNRFRAGSSTSGLPRPPVSLRESRVSEAVTGPYFICGLPDPRRNLTSALPDECYSCEQ